MYIHCWTSASPSSFHFVRSIATCCQFVPTILLILLVHRSGGLPIGLVVGGLHDIIFLVHRSSVVLAICPAQFHFSFAIRSMTSTTFVCCRIHWFVFLSLSDIPSILLPMAL